MSQIELRPMTRELCHAFYREFENDPAIFADRSKFYSFAYTPAWADAYFDRQMSLGRLLFAVMLEGRPIGEVKLWDLDPQKRECNLGIHLANDRWKGRGYGTAAERLALDYSFRELGLEAVNADVILKNTRSQQVLEKAGFHHVRSDENHRYYRCEKGNATWKSEK
ncbi:MAG: GNAT family N-acetyltransferase [Oscillospiraceae bacterium]|nr:GNAT family N-acetyltransferase [Oscillospiraceae bacterium]